MCEPTSWAMLAMAAVGTAVSLNQQQEAAHAQEDAANKAAEADYNALNEAAREQAMQTTEQMNARARMAMEDQARLRVVAGEHGLSGVSVAGLSQDIEEKSAQDMATLASDLDNKMHQSSLDALGIASRQTSRINNIRQPDWVGAGLQIAGAAAKAYGNGSLGGGGVSKAALVAANQSDDPIGALNASQGWTR